MKCVLSTTFVLLLANVLAAPLAAQSQCDGLRAEATRLAQTHVRSLVALQVAARELEAADANLRTLMPDSADLPGVTPDEPIYQLWLYWLRDPLFRGAGELRSAIDEADDDVGRIMLSTVMLASYRQALDRVQAAERRARRALATVETQQTALVAAFRVLERDCGGVMAMVPPRDPGVADGTYRGRASIRPGSNCIADAYTIEIAVEGRRFDGAFLRHGGERDGQPFPVRGVIDTDGELIPEQVGGVRRESFVIRFIDGGIVGEWSGGGCFMTYALSRQR